MVVGMVGMLLLLFFFFLGYLAFGGKLEEEVGTFRSCSISLHCKPQNSFRNDHFLFRFYEYSNLRAFGPSALALALGVLMGYYIDDTSYLGYLVHSQLTGTK